MFALYHLASSTDYMKILREEVDGVFAQEGWSKAALGKMRKLDSFLKEVLRLNPPGICEYPSISARMKYSHATCGCRGAATACPAAVHVQQRSDDPGGHDARVPRALAA